MVIGSGMIATRFNKYATNDDFLIFASGVSNSKTASEEACQREFNLLQMSIAQNTNKTIVYFSTCSVYDPSEQKSMYVQHKLRLEDYVRENARSYIIFRVSNVVGRSSNPNTVLNFLAHCIYNGVRFGLWTNATRNLIDIDDFYRIADCILQQRSFENTIINIANTHSYKVVYIVEHISAFYKKTALYNAIDKGEHFLIDTTDINGTLEQLNIQFNEDYMDRLMAKYYSPNEL